MEAGAKVIISGTREEKVTKTVEKLGNAVRGIKDKQETFTAACLSFIL